MPNVEWRVVKKQGRRIKQRKRKNRVTIFIWIFENILDHQRSLRKKMFLPLYEMLTVPCTASACRSIIITCCICDGR